MLIRLAFLHILHMCRPASSRNLCIRLLQGFCNMCIRLVQGFCSMCIRLVQAFSRQCMSHVVSFVGCRLQ